LCGKPVGAVAAPPEPSATRKTVTVFFSDLTGSTALGERLDPESVRALMAPVYASMRSEVERRDGTVAKFVGDGVMAVFGVPEVREDDAVRALDAAAGMRAAIDRLSADLPVRLSLKIGMNTGEVVIGAGDEDIVGDCVNVASRLEGAAAPGEVLVGEDTWRLTRSDATYEPVAPLTLKGKSQPVPAYRLVSLERTQEPGSATFVGRDAELDRLVGAFDDAIESNASRLVSIVGSPGLGKTRLARELGTVLADRALVVETRCDVAGTATFAPVAETLRTAAGIDESAPPETIVESIKNLVADDEDADRIARRAAALLGAGEAGSTEETFWAIRRLIESAAHARPLVLVLDDMQWAEPLLLDLVEHLAQWIRTAPVLLVVTGRPELREIRPSFAERDVCISLEGLDGHATEQLAQGLLGSDRVPGELLARLPASTEGNPLFVREFVRMLVDDGVLRRSGDEWISTVNVDAIEVPPTIQSLLAARVDRLTSHERTVLELASVVGKEFYRGAVDELAPASVRAGLDAHLESLRRKELVEPAGTYWIDEPVFHFHHALIRDAAYRRLLKESRAELHERVANWLEGKTGGLLGEHAELVGYHLEQAHESRRQLGPLDDRARALGERAAVMLRTAATGALDLDDLASAATLSGRALERLEDGHPMRAGVLLVRCEALLATGDMSAAAAAIEELELTADTPRLAAWATCFAGEYANLTDPARLHETEKRVMVAARELAELGDAAGAAKAHTVRATALAQLGRVAECEVALDDALTAAREAGDRRRVTDVLGRAPKAALWGPSPVSRAGGRCLDIVRLLRITTGSPAVEATSLRCQAVLEAFRGRADAARRMVRKARRDLEELGLAHGIYETEMFAGIVELAAAEPAAAIEHLQVAHAGLRAMGIDVDAGRAAALLARAHLLLAEEDEAEKFALESETLGGDDLKTSIAWRAVRAQILARRGRVAEARALAESAVEIASRTDALIDHGDACAALAAVCTQAGDAAGARRAEEQAHALYERKGATALLEMTTLTAAAAKADASPEADAVVPLNRCARLALKAWELLQADDWDGLAALISDDVEFVDNRSGLRAVVEGKDAQLETFRTIRDFGARVVVDVIATRGERLALTRLRFTTDDPETPFEVELLSLADIDDDGRLIRGSQYDIVDFDAAMAELDARFIADEGAPFAEEMETAKRFLTSVVGRDVSDMLGPGFVVVDHRSASFPPADAQGAEAQVASLGDLSEALGAYAASVDALRPGGILATVVVTGTTLHGTDFEQRYRVVATMRDGLITRIERFAAEDSERAMARLEELTSPSTAKLHENRASRAARLLSESIAAADWGAVDGLLSPNYVWTDRRSGLGTIAEREVAVQNFRAIPSLGSWRVELEVVALRGERLALTRERFVSADDADVYVEYFNVVTTTDEGRLVANVLYDVNALREAVADLDERHMRDDGARMAAVSGEAGQLVAGLHAGDGSLGDDVATTDVVENAGTRVVERILTLAASASWDEIAALHAAGCRFQDHRISGEATADPIAFWPGVLGTAPSATVFCLGPRGEALVRIRDAGGAGALVGLFLDDAGLVELAQVWREDDLMSAIEAGVDRFMGLDLPDTALRLGLLFNAGDWDAFGEILTDDFELVDHRSASLGRMGAEEFLASQRALSELLSYQLVPSVLHAVRGELMLGRALVVGSTPDGAELEMSFLALNEFRDGRIARVEFFPLESFDDARARFDELAEAAELETRCVRVVRNWTDLFARRDWNGIASLLSPDFVLDDRRPGIQDVRSGEEGLLVLKGLADVGVTRLPIESVVTRGQRLALVELLATGPADTVTFENPALTLIGIDELDRIAFILVFDPHGVDTAYEELDARYLAGEAAQFASCRVVFDHIAAYNAREWDRMRTSATEDFVFVDHRPASSEELVGIDALIAFYQGLLDLVPDARIRIPRVHRIDRHGVVCPTIGSGHSVDGALVDLPYETFALLRDGLICRAEVFAAGQASAALARFSELTRASAATPAAFVMQRYEQAFERSASFPTSGTRVANKASRTFDRVLEHFGRHDWDALAAEYSTSFVVQDRRPGLRNEASGREGAVEGWRAAAEVGATRAASTVLATRGERLALTGVGFSGDDSEFATRVVFLNELDSDGLISSALVLDPDDLARAFDELDARYTAGEAGLPDDASGGNAARRATAAGDDDGGLKAARDDLSSTDSSEARPLENLATRAERRVVDAYLAADWDAFAEAYAPDQRSECRRPGLRNETFGREGALDNARAVRSVGVDDVAVVPIAVRGERLALVREVFSGKVDEAYETVNLQVIEAGPDGRVAWTVAFDPDDYADAFAELDARYAAGEGAAAASVVRVTGRFLQSVADRDWATARSCLADDFVFVDNRPASLGTHTADSWLESVRVLADVMPGMHARYRRYVCIDTDIALVDNVVMAEGAVDAHVEIANLAIVRATDDAITHMELFPPDAIEDAIGRFEDLHAAASVGNLENACTRLASRYVPAFEAQDWETLAGLFAEDSVWDDRRPGFQSTLRGRDGRIENLKAIVSVGGRRFRYEPIATRGERLALLKTRMSDEVGEFYAETLQVAEVNTEGLLSATVVFEPEQLDEAFAELDARFLASTRAPEAGVVRLSLRFFQSLNERDWDGMRQVLAADVEVIDRRRVSLGELHGREAWISAFQAMRELSPDRWTHTSSILDLRPDGAVVQIINVGTGTGGGAVEDPAYALAVTRQNRMQHVEIFPTEQLDFALARLDELCATGGLSLPLENLCTRRALLGVDAFNRGDFEAYASLWAADATREDRRSGLGVRLEARDAIVDNFRHLADLGLTEWRSFEPIAMRGDKVALFHAKFGGSADYDVEYLSVGEVDADGLYKSTVHFDIEDLGAAFVEMDRRYLSAEGAAHAATWAPLMDVLGAYARRDWERFSELFSDDVVFADRRPTSLGGRDDVAQILRAIRAGVDVVPDLDLSCRRIIALDEGRAVLDMRATGSNADGGRIERDVIFTVGLINGRVRVLEYFAAEDIAAALARFEQLRTDSVSSTEGVEAVAPGDVAPPENEATRRAMLHLSSMCNDDWETFESLIAPQVVHEDRRTGISNVLVGPQALVDSAHAARSVGVDEVEYTPIAALGEHVALGRALLRASAPDAPFETETLALRETDDAGRLTRLVYFDPDDLDAAFAEIENAAAHHDPLMETVWRIGYDVIRAFNERDFEHLRSNVLAEDFVYVDHQAAGVGTLNGPDAYLESARTLLAMLPWYRMRVVADYVTTTRGGVFRLWERGLDNDGNVVEYEYATAVIVNVDGRLVRAENFPIERRDEAVRRFEELTGHASSPENAATGRVRQLWEATINGDWSAVRSLFTSEFRFEDRRSGLRTIVDGAEGNLDALKAIHSVGTRTISVEPLATRGDRLALCSVVFGTTETTTVPILQLVEVDDAGRGVYAVNFDPDDIGSAFAELDTRYLEGEGADLSIEFRRAYAFFDYYNARAWGSLLGLLAHDFVCVDHRPVALEALDRNEFVKAFRVLADLAPDDRLFLTAVHAMDVGRAVVSTTNAGSTNFGASVETALVNVIQMVDGQIVRIEHFAAEQLSDALARFDELSADSDSAD
jgi:class 3 adenylate cyclase/ketosteroid isomerase-like protein/tetratricopeptide (TPR) repeat protein